MRSCWAGPEGQQGLLGGRPHSELLQAPTVSGGRREPYSHDFISQGPSLGETNGNSLTASGHWEARARAVTRGPKNED